VTAALNEMSFPRDNGPHDWIQNWVDPVYRLVMEATGLDLRLYRQGTVTRRLWGRIQQLRLRGHEEYLELLASDSQEVRHLLAHVTIKVSSFMRNPELWAILRERVLPELLRSGSKIRAWSAGGGRGEEAYSLAILLTELAEREGRPLAAAIESSDIDEEALVPAQEGLYPRDVLNDLPETLVKRYFTEQAGRFGPMYRITDEIRSMVRFSRQNLLVAEEGPGGGPYDLVLCRNVLIYLLRPSQERVTGLLARSLRAGGYLCLGEAESLTRAESASFVAVDRRAGLYQRTAFAWKEGQHANG
jgi:chemotaxis methyl-accepting protein methylase